MVDVDVRQAPIVKIEIKCYPWDFSPILNVIVTQLSPSDSRLLPLSRPQVTQYH